MIFCRVNNKISSANRYVVIIASLPRGKRPFCSSQRRRRRKREGMGERLNYRWKQGGLTGHAQASFGRGRSIHPASIYNSGVLPCRSEEHTSELQSRFDLVC